MSSARPRHTACYSSGSWRPIGAEPIAIVIEPAPSGEGWTDLNPTGAGPLWCADSDEALEAAIVEGAELLAYWLGRELRWRDGEWRTGAVSG